MSARIVLACWGSYGDLFPSIAVGRVLRMRGHSVVVATCEHYRDLVAAEHLAFAPLRPDVDPSDTGLIARVMDPARGTERIVRELLMPALREQYTDLRAAANGADLLVSHPVTFAAPILGDAEGLRWIASLLAPIGFFSAFDFPRLPPHPRVVGALTASPIGARIARRLAQGVTRRWTRPVRDLRRELGLPAGGDPLFDGQFSPLGTIALFSRVLATPQPDWPPRVDVTGFAFYNRPATVPDAVDAFCEAGPPPIVFTLGSSAAGAPGDFYEESLAAARAIGRRALLMIRADLGAHPVGPIADDAMAVDYAPHEAIFPRAGAIVHHGGIGTTGQALRAGRPMLVVPHAHDQPDNAHRVRRLGVGQVLPAAQYRRPAAARELARLLSGPAARRAQEVAAVVRLEPGAAGAADAIERTLRAAPR